MIGITSWKGIVWASAAILIVIALVYTATLGAFGVLAALILVVALVVDPLGMGVYDRIRRMMNGRSGGGGGGGGGGRS